VQDDPALAAMMERLGEPLEPWRVPVVDLRQTLKAKYRNSPLGHLMADATLAEGRRLLPEGTTITLAVMNGGGIRAPLQAGTLTKEDLLRVMPFDNTVSVIQLDALQRAQLLDMIAKGGGTFLHVAGARVEYSTQEPLVRRLLTSDGTEIPADHRVVIALNSYLADGGDSMEFLRGARVLARGDKLLRDVLRDRLLELTGGAAWPLDYAWPACLIQDGDSSTQEPSRQTDDSNRALDEVSQ